MSKVLITGGAGFIGSRLARRLREHHDVVVFDNLLPQVHSGNAAPPGWLDGIELVRGDVRDAEALTALVRRVSPALVWHLAAETGTGQSYDEPARYTAVNVQGTSNLIEALRAGAPNLQRVMLAGSRSVYGEGACVDAEGRPAPAVERLAAHMKGGDFAPRDAAGRALTPVPTAAQSCVVRPASIYASSKLMQEYLLKQAFWGTPVDVGILRLQNVYGPGQSLNNPYTGVISIFRRQIEEGKTLRIFEDGAIVRDFVFVDDVVEAFAALGGVARAPEGPVDIGSGEPVSILDMARLLMALIGAPERLTVTGEFRAGDIRYAVADISAARAALGWTPKLSLREGLGQFLGWRAAA